MLFMLLMELTMSTSFLLFSAGRLMPVVAIDILVLANGRE
jgi:hypothetical protein